MLSETIKYILSLLLYGNTEASDIIGYTANRDEWSRYRLVIIPKKDNLLRGASAEQPTAHDNIDLYLPDLSVSPKIEKDGNTFVCDTDIVYNTFFLISRAEELLNTQRDEHGRFLARHSILGEHNRLLIPTVDEYSRLLCKTLSLGLPEKQIARVNLTHDIDILTRYRSLRSLCGALLHGEARQALRAIADIHADPAYTFPWIIDTDSHWQTVRGQKSKVESHVIYFLKFAHAAGFDRPQYHHSYLDMPRLATMLRDSGAAFGLHSSYASDKQTDLIAGEYRHLRHLLAKWDITCQSANRNHYLRSTSPDHFCGLVEAGITDDYTMGFADCCGFRLGTTRAVRWINPRTGELTPLTLHPLTIMDCSLSDENYMHLSEDEAFYYCQRLIEQTRRHHGELTLLFHNQLLTPGSYHRSLYTQLLEII